MAPACAATSGRTAMSIWPLCRSDRAGTNGRPLGRCPTSYSMRLSRRVLWCRHCIGVQTPDASRERSQTASPFPFGQYSATNRLCPGSPAIRSPRGLRGAIPATGRALGGYRHQHRAADDRGSGWAGRRGLRPDPHPHGRGAQPSQGSRAAHGATAEAYPTAAGRGLIAVFGLHFVKPGVDPRVCFAPVTATSRPDRRAPRESRCEQVSTDVQGAARSRIQDLCKRPSPLI